ncbi:MAG: hypothetical protein AUJ52_10525 [Elusimicrobia bacterium CG1_02_63_36]|nr:MAG: hypothetical protein AUJ52_10525 [Elusimicrobia bacterium CG1_02_63_36]PIP84336.1 MAG: hypothetical protein COR54_04655 [Elusimicrobia bacterium CG22_combo_CG10-13_8_21_14_all_63_91]PJA17010.1 MAG: hypothetical protein COX66_05765 [Elusimicrobia bacterium CG_4_10_14_0_2_um_filter_63_34]PJB25733.1 MAG: hypothetical protein CO113_07015 [Elusimicrobia bacterium CG_4_9_14_3_um_filter_62_55]
MLDDACRRELLQAAASEALRRDFERMSAHAAAAGRKMSVDDLIAFLDASQAAFGLSPRSTAAEPYPRALL